MWAAKRALAELQAKIGTAEKWLAALDGAVTWIERLRDAAEQFVTRAATALDEARTKLAQREKASASALTTWRATSNDAAILATRVQAASDALDQASLRIEVLVRALPPIAITPK